MLLKKLKQNYDFTTLIAQIKSIPPVTLKGERDIIHLEKLTLLGTRQEKTKRKEQWLLMNPEVITLRKAESGRGAT